jgi:transcription-repair coupling factor (superfamily II helicase)
LRQIVICKTNWKALIYEDTPDQTKSTAEVKADMESDDRLVCGDVGFGKQKLLFVRFKAVDNSKQVAILVPTTILAYQHYRTFTERLKDMPVSVGYLNRFRTAKQKAETLKLLAEGKLDIVIEIN